MKTKYSATLLLTLQPNDEQAYSMTSRMYQYYWHSTNHSRSFDQQNATSHQPSLEMNERANKKRLTKPNGLESETKVSTLKLLKRMKQHSAVKTQKQLKYLQQASAISLLLLLHPCSETETTLHVKTSSDSGI
jgi:hypothetical protein